MVEKLENILKGITEKYESEKDSIKFVAFVVMLMSFAAYTIYICFAYTLPDGLLEGLFYYHSQDWHLACGRWAVRYFLYIFGHNVVMPQLVIFGYAVCIAASVLIIKGMFKFESKIDLFLLSAFFMVTPAVIRQILYPHIAVTYAVSFLLAVLAVRFCWNGKVAGCIGGIVCVTLLMGLYQSYIGAATVLVVIVAIVEILDGKDVLSVILKSLKCALVVVVGSLINIGIYTKCMEYYGIGASERVAEFSVAGIFTNLPVSFKDSYLYFINYFNDEMLNRNYLYIILTVIFVFGLLVALYQFIRENGIASVYKVAVILVLVGLVPFAMNIVHILIPYSKVSLLMQYHYVLILPLIIALLRRTKINYIFIQPVVALIVAMITFTYVISANATNQSLRASYMANQTQVNLILSDVYELEGFIPNATDIVFGGFPSEAASRFGLEIYEYAIGLNSKNQAFWDGNVGVTLSRMHYLLNYCGIDAGYLTDDDYYDTVATQEFEEMPIWPAEGSVKMINGRAAVKLSYDYPRREE